MIAISPTIRASLAGMFIAVVWVGWILISKYGVSQNLTIWDIVGLRYGTATVCTLPLLYLQRKNLHKIFNRYTFISALAYGLFYLSFSLNGFRYAPASVAAVIVNGLVPVLCALIVYIWKGQKLSSSKYFGISLLLLANLVLAIQTQSAEFHILGYVFFFGACCSLSFFNVSANIWRFETKYFIIAAAWINFFIFLPAWLFFLPSNLDAAPASEMLLQASYQGILVSVISLALTTYALPILGVVRLAIFYAFVPALAAIFSWLVLGETLSLPIIISVGLCTIGIILFNIRR